MDKFVRLLIAAAMSWAGLSAYLTGGEKFWLEFHGAPDWGKALVGLAAFQIAPYLPTMVSQGGGGNVLSGGLQRLLVIGGPAFAAMTVAAGLQHGWEEWRVGAAAAGLTAAGLAYRGLSPMGGLRLGGGSGADSTLRSAVEQLAARSGLPTPAHGQEVRLRYVGSDGAPQFLNVPPGRA